MTADRIGFALLILGALLAMGKLIRVKTPVLQRLFLPSSLVAGIIALILGREVLGRVSGFNLFSEDMITVWASLPGLMINIVFAALFIGKRIPSLRKVWQLAGPQVMLGYTISFGQYAVGLALSLLILSPYLGINPMAGVLIEIGFVGGHGTAAGLRETFEEMNFAEGADLAVGLATIGVISGVLIGVALINWGMRKGHLKISQSTPDRSQLEQKGIIELDTREPAGFLTTRAESIEPLSLHVSYIALAILIGLGLLEGLVWVEARTWGALTGVYLLRYVPLFPLAMVGGIAVQKVLSRFDRYATLDRQLINRIQGLALDILIVSALATLSLSVIGEHMLAFLILAAAGILWTTFSFLFLARWMLPDNWFERGIGDFGQSMGVTATGLLLMRVADPDNLTPALESFGYKQLMFELFVGGGLFTATSIPLIYQFGAGSILMLTAGLTFTSLLVGLLQKRKVSHSS